MPEHLTTGLLITVGICVGLGIAIALQHMDRLDRPSAPVVSEASGRKKKDPGKIGFSPLKFAADLLFFWIDADFRYVVAYPLLLFGVNIAIAANWRKSLPARLLNCDADPPACLRPWDIR